MSFEKEFFTVDIILNSNSETRAVDAFALSLLKVERQIRRLFTFLIYQHDNYNIGDGKELRNVLVENRAIYLKNFIRGIDLIFYKTVEEIYGVGYVDDFRQIDQITSDRNKIFHGQVTGKYLSRADLIARVDVMKKWCRNVAKGFLVETGYDGFARNAYQKTHKKLNLKNRERFESLSKYEGLLKEISKLR